MTYDNPGFFAWMDDLNREAVRRGIPDWPLPDEIAHDENCWLEDFKHGLTPAQALDANYGPWKPQRRLNP
jgi:hypothetical protein